MKESLESLLQSACLLEARAPKLGNVHPDASFDDLHFEDFVRSAEIVAPILAHSCVGVGPTILAAIEATQTELGKNTNLGIVLLLAPLAAARLRKPLQNEIASVLDGCSEIDSALVFEAIRLANAGGMGKVEEEDIWDVPKMNLREVMRLAEERDLIAQQYSTDFAFVLSDGVELYKSELQRNSTPESAIVGLQLQVMSQFPDSLIARKCGAEVAAESAKRAAAVLKLHWPSSAALAEAERFDQWLRADGNRRNPGTTADIICAILFAYLRDHQ
ncbi:MAG: triphosphoribosyl-dephospho-CoA synthetase [Planctomycetaceae bacterium]|nr:triphosphoribosyl-dephospho-CoA synthetase [Planctomycetaceae bacterium]